MLYPQRRMTFKDAGDFHIDIEFKDNAPVQAYCVNLDILGTITKITTLGMDSYAISFPMGPSDMVLKMAIISRNIGPEWRVEQTITRTVASMSVAEMVPVATNAQGTGLADKE